MSTRLSDPRRYLRATLLCVAPILIACEGTLVGEDYFADASTSSDASVPSDAPPDVPLDEDAGTGGDAGTVNDASPPTDAPDTGPSVVEPPAPSVGDIRWLLDGETGSWGGVDSPHDGATRSGCRGSHPETALISDSIPRHTGDFSIELRLEEDWPWGETGCSPAGRMNSFPRILLLSHDIAPIQRDEEVWVGWAVRIPEDWAEGQRQSIVKMHRGGYGAHFWIELSDDLVWRLTSRAPLPRLADTPLDIAPAAKEEWHEFVMHARMSQEEDLGSITIWERVTGEAEWTLALEYEGATAVPDSALTFSAFPVDAVFSMSPVGRGNWNGPGRIRHLYLDEVRVGGPDSNFDEVAPGSNTLLELP